MWTTMEGHIDLDHGLMGLIASLVIALCLHLILKIVSLVIATVKNLREADGKKIEKLMTSMQENTKAIYVLNESLKTLDNRIIETDITTVKNEKNLNRLVAAVKEVAGDRWGEIQKKVRDDEFQER